MIRKLFLDSLLVSPLSEQTLKVYYTGTLFMQWVYWVRSGLRARLLYVNMILQELFGKLSYFCRFMIAKFVSISTMLKFLQFFGLMYHFGKQGRVLQKVSLSCRPGLFFFFLTSDQVNCDSNHPIFYELVLCLVISSAADWINICSIHISFEMGFRCPIAWQSNIALALSCSR